MSGMLALPEACIAAVISFTTPRDACRLACVSTTFKSAADSDVVWDLFLPPEYSSSSSSSSTTWSALSKKELYFRTCHNLIHKGKLSFWFDLLSGKKCYMISARELNIVDGDNIFDWWWVSLPVADARLRFLVPHNCSICFLDDEPAEVIVGLARSNNEQYRTVYIHREQQDGDDDGFYPKKRADGWLETELGEFFNRGDEEGELLITINSVMKEGLTVQGIEIRPKKE